MIGIGDFDAKSRNTRKVCTREGQRLYMGKKYAQDKKDGLLCLYLRRAKKTSRGYLGA